MLRIDEILHVLNFEQALRSFPISDVETRCEGVETKADEPVLLLGIYEQHTDPHTGEDLYRVHNQPKP